jgi:hypothetical protein
MGHLQDNELHHQPSRAQCLNQTCITSPEIVLMALQAATTNPLKKNLFPVFVTFNTNDNNPAVNNPRWCVTIG